MPPNNQNPTDPNAPKHPGHVVVPGGGTMPVIDPSKFFLPDYPAGPADNPAPTPAAAPQPPASAKPAPANPYYDPYAAEPAAATPVPKPAKREKRHKHRLPVLPIVAVMLCLLALALFFRIRDKNQPGGAPTAGVDIGNLGTSQGGAGETFLNDIANSTNPTVENPNGNGVVTNPGAALPPPSAPAPAPGAVLPPPVTHPSSPSPSPGPSPSPTPTPTPSPPPSTPGGTIGNTAAGNLTANPGSNYKFGSKFSTSGTIKINRFSVYLKGGASTSYFIPVIYNANSAGDPTTLVLKGNAIVVNPNQSLGWARVAVTTTTLPAGNYVIGLLSGTESSKATLYYQSQSGGAVFNSNAYPNPSNPWGSISREDRKWSFYADFN